MVKEWTEGVNQSEHDHEELLRHATSMPEVRELIRWTQWTRNVLALIMADRIRQPDKHVRYLIDNLKRVLVPFEGIQDHPPQWSVSDTKWRLTDGIVIPHSKTLTMHLVRACAAANSMPYRSTMDALEGAYVLVSLDVLMRVRKLCERALSQVREEREKGGS